MGNKIEIEEVRKVASLAKLSFTEEEEKEMQKDLSNILTYMEVLNDVDISKIDTEGIISTNTNYMREDKVVRFENVDKILKNAKTIENKIVIPEK